MKILKRFGWVLLSMLSMVFVPYLIGNLMPDFFVKNSGFFALWAAGFGAFFVLLAAISLIANIGYWVYHILFWVFKGKIDGEHV